MRCFRSPLAPLAPLVWAALLALSCGSPTGVDRSAGAGVAAVSVDPPASTVILGAEVPFRAAVIDGEGKVVPNAPIVWTVRDPEIATVSTAGVVTGRAVGSTQVAASAGGRSAVATVTVRPPPVASVVVQPGTASLTPGSTATLSAAVTDVNGALAPDRAVRWTTSDALVAVVSATGVVTAAGPGSAIIGAESEGKTGTATVTVSPPSAASVTVEPAGVTLPAGRSTVLTAAVKDAAGNVLVGRAVVWSTSNASVATVSTSGSVTAVATGTAAISASIDGRSGSSTVTVTPAPVASVAVQPESASLIVGQRTTLAAVVTDANGAPADRVVTWTSANEQVASVSAAGVVTAVAPGQATITATSEGKSGTSAITVTPAPVASVTVQPPTMALVVGQTSTATAVLKDANGNTLTGRVVTWTSSNPLVASVSGTGVVTGVAPGGPVFVTASSEGWNGSTSVTVTPVPVGSVALPTTTTLVAGQSATLTPVVKDANGVVVTDRVVTWTSSNPTVATVSATGLVRALVAGQATITATSEGKSGSTVLTVTPAPVGSVSVLPSTPTLISGSTVALTATVKDVNGATVTDRVVTWKSSDVAVATVSSSGVVTGLVAGTATITATSESRSGTATVTVIAGPAATVTVAPTAVSVRDGTTVQLTATATDARGNAITGRPFTWTTSDATRATVSSTGRVTAKKVGTVIITATLDGASDTSQITITP